MRRAHAVEQIVAGDHHHAEDENRRRRQPYQRCQHDHRPPQCPDHHEHRDLVVGVELKAEAADDGELKHDQPHATQKQEARQVRRRATAAREKRAGAGEQEERRCAQVRNPPCQEQRHRRLREVEWVEAGYTEIVAHVIERHQDHDAAAQRVDRGQPSGPDGGPGARIVGYGGASRLHHSVESSVRHHAQPA
jgi:hypothetical protein